jgi:putative nucleotidyltransferase with HDIG domain
MTHGYFLMANQNPAADAAPITPPEGLCRLPQFRPVALKLLKLVSAEDVAFSEVAGLLSADPAFSAEVLALANSPLYSSRIPATSLTRAIVVLGLERTRSLTLTVAMQAFVGNVQVTPALQNSWRHSLACALVAEELSPLYGISGDHGYTAGLMHDIGRLGLLKAYPKPYALLLANAYESIGRVLEAERRVFQVDHCQSGLWLTRSWGFPQELQAIAEHHHAGRFGREQGVVGLASVSCLLTDMLGFPAVNYSVPAGIEELVSGMPGPAHFDLAEMRDRILARLQTVDIAA